jgi:hypothetical protein
LFSSDPGFSPANREELFNLRHASARNVVERIFGALKKRFSILTRAPEYDMSIQARIPPSCAALHNFILKNDPTEVNEIANSSEGDPNPGNLPPQRTFGILARGPPNTAERARAKAKRNEIAQAMWDSYQIVLAERGEGYVLE